MRSPCITCGECDCNGMCCVAIENIPPCPKCGACILNCGHVPAYPRSVGHRSTAFVFWLIAVAVILAALMGRICSAADSDELRLAPGVAPVRVPTEVSAQAIRVPAVSLAHTEADAVGWVFDALQNYPQATQPYVRFVYLEHWQDAETIGASDYWVNSALSHARQVVRGDRFAGGYLLGYNFLALCPDPAKRAKLLATWDGLAIEEGKFHVPKIDQVTKTPVAILAPHLAEKLAVHTTDAAKSERVDALIAQITRGAGAVYPASFVAEQLLTSTRGKYIEFRQFPTEAKDGLTQIQILLKDRGFFQDASIGAGGDRGSIILRRRLGKKPTVVLSFPGISSNVPALFTFDKRDKNIRPDERFVRNLVEFTPFADASEGLIPMRHGGIEYVLADGQGKITRVAPPDVVPDDEKPRGATKELETGSSCIVCHFIDNGYPTIPNDLHYLLDSGADYFGEELTLKSGRKLTREQAVDIVSGRFGVNLDDADGILGRARRDFIRFTNSVTDYEIKADGPSSAAQVGAKTKSILFDYRYDGIDAARVCFEQGVIIPKGMNPRLVYSQLWPKVPEGAHEDQLIAMVRKGATINRDDYDALHVEYARRAVETRKQFAKGGGK